MRREPNDARSSLPGKLVATRLSPRPQIRPPERGHVAQGLLDSPESKFQCTGYRRGTGLFTSLSGAPTEEENAMSADPSQTGKNVSNEKAVNAPAASEKKKGLVQAAKRLLGLGGKRKKSRDPNIYPLY